MKTEQADDFLKWVKLFEALLLEAIVPTLPPSNPRRH